MANAPVRKIIPIEDLKENPWNPNQMSTKAWEALGESISEFGEIDALIVRSHGDGFQIIDGAHRYRWAKERGIEELPCDVVEVSDSQAKRLTQILNRTRGEDDPAKLKELLDSLISEIGADEAISGMAIADVDELDELLKDLESEIDERLGFGSGEGIGDDIPDDNKDIDEEELKKTKHKCPECGYEW